MENNTPLLCSISQTMELLNLPRRTMYSLMNRGALPPSFRLGGRRVFRRADLTRWIDLGMPPLEKFQVLAGAKK
jgi:excisionase family DNA binding protein